MSRAKGRWHPEESRGKVTEPLRAHGCVRPNANVVPGHALGPRLREDDGVRGGVQALTCICAKLRDSPVNCRGAIQSFATLSPSCHESSCPGIGFRERQSPNWRRRAKRAATPATDPATRCPNRCAITRGRRACGHEVWRQWRVVRLLPRAARMSCPLASARGSDFVAKL